MAKITSIRITEQFEHFLKDLKESLWGDLYGQTRLAWKKFWEIQSVRERDSYMKTGWYEQVEPLLRVGLCDATGHDSAADCTHPGFPLTTWGGQGHTISRSS